MDKIEYRAVIKFFVKEGLIISVFCLLLGIKGSCEGLLQQFIEVQ
jgi:hypothetical protein